jgi:hypothetical protein
MAILRSSVTPATMGSARFPDGDEQRNAVCVDATRGGGTERGDGARAVMATVSMGSIGIGGYTSPSYSAKILPDSSCNNINEVVQTRSWRGV